MNNNSKHYFLFVLVAVVLLISCTEQTDKNALSTVVDDEFLSVFFLASNTKDFPGQGRLEVCRAKINEPCHKIIERIELAREKLLKMSHEKALLLVLEQIHQYCKLEKRATLKNESRCSGAFSAIYYFNSAADEKTIINSLSLLDEELLIELFRTRRSWVFNRTELKLWEEFAKVKLSSVWQDIFFEDLHQQTPIIFGLKLLD